MLLTQQGFFYVCVMSNKLENVLILGASTTPTRYSYIAARMLTQSGHSIFPVGIKKGKLFGVEIDSTFPKNQAIDTITLYINPKLHAVYINDIIAIKPNRVIFNPGTESDSTVEQLSNKGINCVDACTLVLLRTQQF